MDQTFQIILYVSASLLCLSLIYYFFRITKAIEGIRSELQNVSSQLNPLLESLSTLSKSIRILSEDLRIQLAKSNWIIDEVKSKVEGLIAFEHKIKEAVDNPVQNIVRLLTMIREKLSAFFQKKTS